VNPDHQQLRARVVADSHGYAKIIVKATSIGMIVRA
jgi:hypothetical protein